MATYDRIAELCKRRGISITALENELGFGRGSIGKLKKGITMSSERLNKIAERLATTSDYLLNGDDMSDEERQYYLNLAAANEAQQMYDDHRIRGLNHISRRIDDNRFDAYYQMLVRLYKLDHPEDNYDFNS